MYKCPKCKTELCDTDCECDGDDSDCLICDGDGVVPDYLECVDCGQVYHISDIEYEGE